MSKINLSKRVCFVLTALIVGLIGVSSINSFAGGIKNKNLPPECTAPANTCGCPENKVGAKCIKAIVDLGETTPWTGSLDCSLKIFADNTSPSIFTADSLYAVLGGYTFKRLGTLNLNDGITPAEVVLSHPNGEPVKFVFKEGESWGQPDPGVHIKMDERLMMVDAEGWATTKEPVYYDLYPGDGSRRRFMATNMTGALGQLVSITTPQGVTMTPTDMGIDIVYDSNGVRQFITPSRLANVTHTDGWTGYDVTVYALQSAPKKDPQTGLYTIPLTQPIEIFSVRRENDGKRAIVTVQNSGGEKLRYVFDYAMGDWSLTRPTGAQEQRERYMSDEEAAKIVTSYVSSKGERLEHTEYNYKWESWGFAVTNKIEGFGGITNTTSWTYYTSGNGKGQVKTEKRQSGLLIEYAYDSADRIISEKRSGPDMMTEVMTYDYTPVDASDPLLSVDTRPRTIVKTLNGIECERTYYVYAPLTNIVERVGTQGAAYGGTNVLRTVTAFYPVTGGPLSSASADGRVASVRHEDGKLDLYDYALNDGVWIKTITHLHEQSPAPVSGKTTRDITLTNARGEVIETRTEAFIDNAWHTIARERLTYNTEGKRIKSENLAGQVTTSAWDCCHKISEVQPDGSTTMWEYDEEGRMIASSRLIPLDMTNVTWLTTCYEYDDLGRQIATWQTNRSAKVGTAVISTKYDALGRIVGKADHLGNWLRKEYSIDGLIETTIYPNESIRVVRRDQFWRVLSETGTAVTPRFFLYGIGLDGSNWTRVNTGYATSPRFTRTHRNMLGLVFLEERSGCNGNTLSAKHVFDSRGNRILTIKDGSPIVSYKYDVTGEAKGVVRSADGTWKRNSTDLCYCIIDGELWRKMVLEESCSDVLIAPLISARLICLTGLDARRWSIDRKVDTHGNVAENWSLFDLDTNIMTEYNRVPYATGLNTVVKRFGKPIQFVSTSFVTNTIVYDGLGREISYVDGRGNVSTTTYNSAGQIESVSDAANAVIRFGYNQFGQMIAVTNVLGNTIVFEYDARGNKIYEGGAKHPVRYVYDLYNNVIKTITYRSELNSVCDRKIFRYDEASGALLQMQFADGTSTIYEYMPDGKLATRTWSRGVTTEYSYDGWGSLTNTVYSDNTPTVAFAYDAMRRLSGARDASGETIFMYDEYGQNTNEVNSLAAIARIYDNFGRDSGYIHTSGTVVAKSYDGVTGRLANTSFDEAVFSYRYVPGTDLEAGVSGPGFDKIVVYDQHSDLVTKIAYSNSNDDLISARIYDYDIGGNIIRRNCKRKGGFNCHDVFENDARGQLTNALIGVDSYAYRYDDAGNRIFSSEFGLDVAYAPNELNQYTNILVKSQSLVFVPEYDNDGNQIFIQTATGDWRVNYDGENRPVLWTCGTTNILMSYDCKGRRFEKSTVINGVVAKVSRYAYDGYLQVAEYVVSNAQTSIVSRTFWDSYHSMDTRPLAMKDADGEIWLYTVDLTKNVCEVLDRNCNIATSYDYTPFGDVSISGETVSNSFQWSSEYNDFDLGLIYYNYRHYFPTWGRWITSFSMRNAYEGYIYLLNDVINGYDINGEKGRRAAQRRAWRRRVGRMSGSVSQAPGDFVSLLIDTWADWIRTQANAREKGLQICRLKRPLKPEPYYDGPVIRAAPCKCCVILYRLVGLGERTLYYLERADIVNKGCDDYKAQGSIATPEWFRTHEEEYFDWR